MNFKMRLLEVRIVHASAQLVILLILESSIVPQIESRATTNKMRYAKGDYSSSRSLPLEQVFDIPSSESSPASRIQAQQSENGYRINRDVTSRGGKLLDKEDRDLLEKFYRETKASDPFLDETLSVDQLWKQSHEEELRALNALLDTDPPTGDSLRGKEAGSKRQHLLGQSNDFYNIDDSQNSQPQNHGGVNGIDADGDHGWTVEPNGIFLLKDNELDQPKTDPTHLDDLEQIVPIEADASKLDDGKQANYSPTLKLLTSYDPIEDPAGAVGPHFGKLRGNKIVGATLYGEDEQSRPSVKSKLAVDAVKMHDELLRKPPNDGKVRVRMYYHRAIHDDAKLWGNGPWKYWGHGWGLEFGYDPKRDKKDFYQKGYTIERAFGRDFCKDKANCRRPDPEFFKDPLNVGTYSQQYHSQLKQQKQLNQRPPVRSYRKSALLAGDIIPQQRIRVS